VLSGAGPVGDPPNAVIPPPARVPTIAVPTDPERGWLRSIVTSLQVHEGRLELWREGVVRLVVLPSCEGAQAVPEGIRAGERVDRAGRAPYPQLW